MGEQDEILSALRQRLDELDNRLVALICERAALAKEIGGTKAAAGLRVYAPDREKQVLDHVTSLNTGPLSNRALRSIYRELMSASLDLERAPRVALLGPPGSYSHAAGRRKFGMSVTFNAVTTIAGVFDEVARGHAEYGLAPIENSIAGGIGATMDALIERDVRVCGEVLLAVHHHVLGTGPLEAVERICSKPEVFQQCSVWLETTGFAEKTVPVPSSSAAAALAKDDPQTAAIASELAAELYDLQSLASHVEDDAGNVTRFLIIGTTTPKPTGSDKTSVVFGAGHKPGALANVLDVLRTTGINMTRIESRPNRHKSWEHYFLVDLQGHAQTPTVANALTKMSETCASWKVLGSYPTASDVV